MTNRAGFGGLRSHEVVIMNKGDMVFSEGRSVALVVLEFPAFRDFIDAYSPIISEQGIFIRDSDVAQSTAFAVGDPIEFEVRLKDDFRLIQGKGEVIRLGTEEAAGGATGSVIRFHEIDEPSQRLIARLVANYVRDGGKLFQMGRSGDKPHGRGDSELTAETLKPSEADALFAGDEEDDEQVPIEIESVAPVDVESPVNEPVESALEAAAPELDPHAPVGLETIAIPAGLLSMSNGQTDSAPKADDEAGELSGLEPSGAASLLEDADGVSDRYDPVVAMGKPPLESSETIPGDLEADTGSYEAAADSLKAELGARTGIPEEIAQVAEELSGVHRFDPPEAEDQSGVNYAGSASARGEANVGGRIAALVVIATLLGATAYYFGDTIRGWFGLDGGGRGEIEADLVRPGEIMASAGQVGGEDPAGKPSAGAASPEVGLPTGDAAGDAAAEAASSDDEVQQSGTGASSVEPGEREIALETRSSTSRKPVAPAGQEPDVADAKAPTASPAAPTAGEGSARKVDAITWRREGNATVVTIRLSTEVSKGFFQVLRVREGAPREVLIIQGIAVPYSPNEVTVGGDHVLRLRTGLHRGSAGSELHVVADLANAGVTILSVEPKGRDLEITFS